jgi:peptidoglycan/xylan/chitin deacetylase (PgdA/CDA1 family)
MFKLKKIIPYIFLWCFVFVIIFSSLGNNAIINNSELNKGFTAVKSDYEPDNGLNAMPEKIRDKEFIDVKKEDYAYEDINKLVKMGIVSGYTDNTFRPSKKVTVGEFVKLLLLSMGYKEADNYGIWYKNYEAKATELGIIDADDNYNFDAIISRKSIAKMICKMLKISPEAGGKTVFADLGGVETEWIDTVFNENLMHGFMSNNRIVFRPNQSATRAEVCSVIARLGEYQENPQNFKASRVTQNQDKRPLAAQNVYAETSENAKEIPVLLYHHLLKKDENKLYQNNGSVISVEEFESQMKLLYDNGFYTITVFELEKYLNNEINLPYKSVLIAFDDGYLSDYTYAYPIMKKYGQVGTVFLLTSAIQSTPQKFNPDFLPMFSWVEVNKSTDVFDFGSHTHALHNKDKKNVSYLVSKPENEIRQDLKHSKEILGTNYFAYPYGQFNYRTVAVLKDLGFTMAFSTKEGNITRNSNPYALSRYTINPGRDISIILKKIYPDLQVK